jgi:DNA-binding transcriptional LysR family regulator
VPLHRDYYLAALPKGHVLAGRNAVSLGDLADHPIIAMRRDANARQVLDQVIQRRGEPLRPRFELLHLFSVGRMVEAGLGVAVLPESAMPIVMSSSIATVEIRSPRIFRDIGLITRRGYQYSPAANIFVKLLKASMQANGARTSAIAPS